MGRKGKGKEPPICERDVRVAAALDAAGLPPELFSAVTEADELFSAAAEAAKEAEEHGGIAMVLTADDLAAALRDKTDEFDERVQEARESERRFETPVENVATAPTVQCSEHEWRCNRCGKPQAMLDSILREAVTITGPCSIVQISQQWGERLEKLAEAQRMTVPAFVELLIKRHWVASGGGRG